LGLVSGPIPHVSRLLLPYSWNKFLMWV
jgi:hypothetical protein